MKKEDELLAGNSPSTSKLVQMKLSLMEKLDVLKQLDGEILEQIEAEALAEEIEHSDEFREGLNASVVRIDECCTMMLAPPPHAMPTNRSSSSSYGVKLPKLSIRPFNEELTSWTTFWDSYNAAIHENPSLSEIDKFNYLCSLFEHSALDAVSGLTLTASHYQLAVEILQKRFGNRQQIITKHTDALLKMEAVAS